jgi:hypothetical protein
LNFVCGIKFYDGSFLQYKKPINWKFNQDKT